MTRARFAVRLPPDYQDPFGLEAFREALRFQVQGSRRLRVVSVPRHSAGGYEVVVSFDGGVRMLWLVATELREAIAAFLPHASVEAPADMDFTRRGGPMLAEPPTAQNAEADRYVNTLVAAAGSQDPVPLGQPLTLDTDYKVLLSIGDNVRASLLNEVDARLPDRLL
ncbi:MAG: hypothetical protein ACRDN0_39855, partial [Trebonia sp.]